MRAYGVAWVTSSTTLEVPKQPSSTDWLLLRSNPQLPPVRQQVCALGIRQLLLVPPSFAVWTQRPELKETRGLLSVEQDLFAIGGERGRQIPNGIVGQLLHRGFVRR